MAEILELKKYEIDALLTAVSKDVTRRHLNVVKFDGPRGVCASTDGHRLCIRHSDSFTGEFLLARSSLELVARLIPKKGHATFTADRIAVMSTAGSDEEMASIRPTLFDVEFPPIVQVIGAYGPGAQMGPIGLNPKLVADACKVFGNLPGRYAKMVVSGKGDLDPIEIVSQDDQTKAWWHVLVMPMRVEMEEIAIQSARLKLTLTPETVTKAAVTTPAKSTKRAKKKAAKQ